MIDRRRPMQDDRRIFQLISTELMPFTRRSFPDFKLTRKDVRHRLSKGRTWVLRSVKTRICTGFITCFIQNRQLWIDMLAIRACNQGRGLGGQLLGRAERYAKQKGCSEVMLYVDVSNPKAQRFYQRSGYIQLNYEPKLKCYLYGKVLDT